MDGLSAESYIEKGILEDMTPMLETVKGELMPNILSAYTMENKVYMLPQVLYHSLSGSRYLMNWMQPPHPPPGNMV